MVSVREVNLEVSIGAIGGALPITMACGDLAGFAAMGIADKPVMLIGADLLKQRQGMVLSQMARKIWLPDV